MNKYYTGWDGGGTATAIKCIDQDAKCTLHLKAGPLNFNGNSLENIKATVKQALTEMQKLPGGLGDCGALCIGSAGISNPNTADMLEKLLRELGYKGEYMLVGDHETALYGAFSGSAGILLIAGTGSICYGKNEEGQIHRCGGFGHLIDDEGSGYAIGRDVLAAIVRSYDGRLPKTMLTELVFEKLKISSIQELIAYTYSERTGKKEIASIAPLFSIARDAKDEAALAIQQKVGCEITKLVVATANALNMSKGNIAFAGSALLKDAPLRAVATKGIAMALPDMAIVEAEHDAAYGAALLARSM